jgi:transcriptional regulator with XRE-family HTH domain
MAGPRGLGFVIGGRGLANEIRYRNSEVKKFQMAGEKSRTLGEVLRRRRRELDMTQGELAQMLGTSTPYVGLLESDQRRPSDAVVTKLSDALGLDSSELFFLANPNARALLHVNGNGNGNGNGHSKPGSAWEQFRNDERLHRLHGVTADEMKMLSQVALMGEISSARDFVYILNTVRHALVR